MIKVKSKEGHWFILENDLKFYIHLKGEEKRRLLGTVHHGEFRTSGLQWIRTLKCWALARFPVVKTETFNIRIIRVFGIKDGRDKEYFGYVHPKLLYKRAEWSPGHYKHKDKGGRFETQVILRPEDLHETEEKAIKKFEAWEEKYG